MCGYLFSSFFLIDLKIKISSLLVFPRGADHFAHPLMDRRGSNKSSFLFLSLKKENTQIINLKKLISSEDGGVLVSGALCSPSRTEELIHPQD